MVRMAMAAMLAVLTGSTADAGAKVKLTPDQQIAQALAGRYAGKPVDCMPSFPSYDSMSFKGAILYKPTATWYLNTFDNSCPQYDDDAILVTRSFTGQLCRGDPANLVDRTSRIFRGACVLGSFTPYTKAPPKG